MFAGRYHDQKLVNPPSVFIEKSYSKVGPPFGLIRIILKPSDCKNDTLLVRTMSLNPSLSTSILVAGSIQMGNGQIVSK
ncbi:MAG: hypothetical protein IPP49_16800 [Saprospiraceae bacterium]|nr:hypothetical protein [Saprospiraceae bacterium]